MNETPSMLQYSREELQAIIERSMRCKDMVLNPFWVKAYEDLALAADRLDAMYARSSIRES